MKVRETCVIKLKFTVVFESFNFITQNNRRRDDSRPIASSVYENTVCALFTARQSMLEICTFGFVIE